jgi:hypothetical protein
MKADSFETENFIYPPDNSLEVVILTSTNGDHDGYLEASAANKLMTPFLNNSTSLMAAAAPSHKLIKNNKSYIHVFSLFKYLSNYNLNNKNHPPEYYTLKSVICDLLMGVQSKSFDPLCDIKSELYSIQESINGIVAVLNDTENKNINNATAVYNDAISTGGINSIKETLQAFQTEFINKMTFNTETLLDNVKSVKDLICLTK